MIKKREFDDAAGQGFEGLEDATIRPGLTAFVGGTFVGAVLGCATAYAMQSLWFAGDEPPIRVKNGSLNVDVLSKTATWEKNGSRKKWKLKSWGTRGRDEFDVVIVTSGKVCVPGSASGEVVIIEYTETTPQGNVLRSVRIESKNKKTEVINASHDLDHTPDERGINFNVPGYISKIKVDAHEWTFASAGDLDYALLMEF